MSITHDTSAGTCATVSDEEHWSWLIQTPKELVGTISLAEALIVAEIPQEGGAA